MFSLRPANHSYAEAAAAAEQGEVVVYWRPGCPFCGRLRMRLGRKAKRATWVDIWRDEDAARFLRSVNDGNEIVPTVVIDGATHTNPDPKVVAAALS